MASTLITLRRMVMSVVLTQAFAAALSVPTLSGCWKPLPEAQSPGEVANITLSSGGLLRSYLVFVPPNYNPLVPTPVILSYHGGTQTAEDQLRLDQLTNPEFNTEAFVIYPQGINDTWQGVPGVTTDDVGFTSDILDQVETVYCLDPSRIWATGKSDGGGLCNVLACDAKLSRRIAAFAPVSGAYYVDHLPCEPETVAIPCAAGRRDIPMLAFHGGDDTVIAYLGGERKGECLPALPHWIQQWAVRDGLGNRKTTIAVAANTSLYQFGGPRHPALVGLVFDAVIGHDWPSTAPNADNSHAGQHPASFNATPMIVKFFKAHPLSLDETLLEEVL